LFETAKARYTTPKFNREFTPVKWCWKTFAFPITKATFWGRAVKLRDGIERYSLKSDLDGGVTTVERIKHHLCKDKSKTFRRFQSKRNKPEGISSVPAEKGWPQNSLGSEDASDFLHMVIMHFQRKIPFIPLNLGEILVIISFSHFGP